MNHILYWNPLNPKHITIPALIHLIQNIIIVFPVYVAQNFFLNTSILLHLPSFYIFAFWFFFSYRFRFWLIFYWVFGLRVICLGIFARVLCILFGFWFFWFLFFLFSASYGTLFPFFFIHLTIWYFIYFCRSMIIRILKF